MEALQFLRQQRDFGNIWVGAQTAADVLGCQAVSLTNAANKKGTLGSIQFCWVGTQLKVSVLSLIRFIGGGYPLREIFGEGGTC